MNKLAKALVNCTTAIAYFWHAGGGILLVAGYGLQDLHRLTVVHDLEALRRVNQFQQLLKMSPTSLKYFGLLETFK